ncbi:MAG: peptidase [Merismopedia sp. SIO2A8]|nr:peptidase [Merismopedia sp. SIO2A8]
MRTTFSRTVLSKLGKPLMVPAVLLSVVMGGSSAIAQTSSMYNPITIPASNEITDTLSSNDIPTGFGGYARDYVIDLNEGDHLVIDVLSDEFDTIVTLIGPDGATFGENDDGPDGTTNSMLFVRVTDPGRYIMRVAPYAGQGFGAFNVKVTRLRPI